MKTIELKHTEIMQRFREAGVEVNIYWNGGDTCSYTFSVNGIELARGNDFRPSPIYNIDNINTMVSLFGFLTVKIGATDPEYFNNHTPEHLLWLESLQRDEINLQISDFENTGGEFNKEAIEYFKDTITLYPND